MQLALCAANHAAKCSSQQMLVTPVSMLIHNRCIELFNVDRQVSVHCIYSIVWSCIEATHHLRPKPSEKM